MIVDTWLDEFIAREGLSEEDEQLIRDWWRIAKEVLQVFCDKHHDYGPKNIAALGEKGVFARVWDKGHRLKRLVWEEKEPHVKEESVENAWVDLADYGIIALLVRRGLWPKT